MSPARHVGSRLDFGCIDAGHTVPSPRHLTGRLFRTDPHSSTPFLKHIWLRLRVAIPGAQRNVRSDKHLGPQPISGRGHQLHSIDVSRQFLVHIVLLWLAGNALRLTILAVPPVIPLIQADLHLSGTEIGVLTGLPIVLFGVAALPGSLLIARFGAVAILVAGLTIAGIASALRGAVPHTFALYAATIVMGAGIAIMQPALPPLVRQWLPKRVSFATALYTNGLLVGETLAVMLTIPVVLPLADNSWQWALAIWGVPLIMIALLTVLLAPAGTDGQASSAQASRAQAPTSGWPNWSNPLIWQIRRASCRERV